MKRSMINIVGGSIFYNVEGLCFVFLFYQLIIKTLLWVMKIM